MPDWAFHFAGYAVAIIAAMGVLLALFRDRAKGRARCRKCWYDLAGAGDLPLLCPECGKAHTKPRHLKKTRRHKRLALVWLLVMMVGGYGLWVVPRVKIEGRHGFVPDFLLMLYVPFLKLPETYNHPRLTEKISQLITRWEKPEHRDELRRFMRVWLAVGLVDPSGYYGDASLQTSADINANLGNWTVAGGIFQDIMPFEDLPKWARWEAIHTSMNGFSLWVEPADEEGDLDVARLMGNARWDAQIGDMLIAITPRESEYPKGVTLIGRKELSEKAHASTLLFADHDIERFTPAVIAADEDGLYLASVRIVEQGELVGEYDIDFALEPYNWRHTDLRIVTARRVNRIER